MAEKVLINLATGLEDGERVTLAFLVAGGAFERGREVAMFLTKEAVRLALPGHAEGVACDGCPPLLAALPSEPSEHGSSSHLGPDARECPGPGTSHDRSRSHRRGRATGLRWHAASDSLAEARPHLDSTRRRSRTEEDTGTLIGAPV